MNNRLSWKVISAWAASLPLLAAGAGLRWIADGLTCGDDGAADYGSPDASAYCRLIDRLDAPGPAWIAFYLFPLAAAVATGLVANQLGSRKGLMAVTGLSATLTVILVVPSFVVSR